MVQDRLDRVAERYASGPLAAPARWLADGWTTAWLIAITAGAAAVAWLASLAIGLGSPVAAALGAILTVTLSVHRSLRSGLNLVVATAAALLLAWGLYEIWGLHLWTVAVLVAVSLIIGRALRLGPEGSLAIPATAIFLYVLGDQLTSELAIQRIISTLIGVVVGIALSFIAHPERPSDRLTRSMSELAQRIGALLDEIGTVAPRGYDRALAEKWLIESRVVARDVRALHKDLESHGVTSRFTVAMRSRHGRQIASQYDVLLHSCDQVNDIARGLFDAVGEGQHTVPPALGALLRTTGTAMLLHAAALPEVVDDGAADTGVLQAVEAAVDTREETVSTIKSLDDTGALLLSSSILADVDRMLDQLSGPAPALEVREADA